MTATETGQPTHAQAARRGADYTTEELSLDLRWWAAANYLTVAPDLPRATTRCCASRCGPSTSSRGCSATGAPARA